MDADGEALTQKKLPKLATIRPSIDLQKGSILHEDLQLSDQTIQHTMSLIKLEACLQTSTTHRWVTMCTLRP